MSGLFGGRSTSSTASSSNTNTDNRQVYDASGGGVVGTGNSISQTEMLVNDNSRYQLDSSQSFADSSDRSVRVTDSRDQSSSFTDWSNRSTSYADSRDMSSSFTDWSNRSTSYADSRDMSSSFSDSRDQRVNIDSRTITDGGAFDIVRNVADGVGEFGLAQVGLARELASRADAMSGGAVDFAVRAQEQAATFADDQAGRAFDLARSSAAQAYASSADALGFVRETFAEAVGLARGAMAQAQQSADGAAETAGAAYASASNTATGNKTLLLAALGAVALVGVAVAMRR